MNLYNEVEKIINEWDPIDLLPIFPLDEYRDEILEIIELLKKARDINVVSMGIKKILSENFGDDVFRKTYEECLEIGRQLILLKIK
jgi:hypothetical protein